MDSEDRRRVLSAIVTVALVVAIGSCAKNRRPKPPTRLPDLGTFGLQCDPFGGLAEHQPIDDHCGVDGVGSANSVAQNHAKNNLCAPPPATVVDVATLQILQSDIPALGIAFGSPQTIPTPQDRPKLQHPDTLHGIAVGEGSLVQFVGFILEAHYSDVDSGESVNCDLPGEPTNDILCLLKTPSDGIERSAAAARERLVARLRDRRGSCPRHPDDQVVRTPLTVGRLSELHQRRVRGEANDSGYAARRS